MGNNVTRVNQDPVTFLQALYSDGAAFALLQTIDKVFRHRVHVALRAARCDYQKVGEDCFVAKVNGNNINSLVILKG